MTFGQDSWCLYEFKAFEKRVVLGCPMALASGIYSTKSQLGPYRILIKLNFIGHLTREFPDSNDLSFGFRKCVPLLTSRIGVLQCRFENAVQKVQARISIASKVDTNCATPAHR